jgi:hypothetical protein
VDVHDENGNKPTPTERANAIARRKEGEGGYVPLKPGETLMHKVNVSKLYDLSRPGKYRIRFRWQDIELKMHVTSNPITVTVTP